MTTNSETVGIYCPKCGEMREADMGDIFSSGWLCECGALWKLELKLVRDTEADDDDE